ncbi:uncharacterized protein PAC_07571 [Phialocephala subalpina]|uniref:Uncharacterized protein n=1 Tax=Phialocephala subalpina TaxID=576137 RepID=A0A1L7WY34_9HELO|nr:uncharacterized protein PAC_07571 [Phialocephala subalpina]
MALTSRRTHRLLIFLSKPLLAALFVTLILRWTITPSNPRKPHNPYPHLSKALIIASTTSSNLTWLDPALRDSHWTPYVYTTDDTTAELTVPINKGNEAMVYLTWIIDHYDTLSDVMFFHHDHNQAWHQMFSSGYELKHLNPETVLRDGYISPRCLPGCENIITLSGDVAPLSDLKSASRDVLISSVLHEFWLDEEGKKQKLPEKIAAPCCAQFAVSKQRVRRRSRAEWEALRSWLIKTNVSSRESGRVLEYTWHLWFGMEDEL